MTGAPNVVELHASIDGGPVRHIVGRFAQTLKALIDAGESGITPLHCPGLRLGHYVFVLRHEYRVAIHTEREEHGGSFPGRHARYRLTSAVERKGVVRAGEGARKRRRRRERGDRHAA